MNIFICFLIVNQFIVENVGKYCQQLGMHGVFENLCIKKREQSENSTEIRRSMSFGELLVVGCLNGTDNAQIQRYCTVSDSWTIVDTIEKADNPHIHSIGNHMSIILTIVPDTFEVEVRGIY